MNREQFFALNDNIGTTTLYADLDGILEYIKSHYLQSDIPENEFETLELKISPCELTEKEIDNLPDWEQ